MLNKKAELSKEKLRKNIEEAIEKNGRSMPEGPYENNIQGWWFDDEEIIEANKEGKLLTLDLDIGKACDLACPFCFADTRSPKSISYNEKTTEKIRKIIDDGIDLGLKTIKVVGAGEPFLFPGLISLIDYAKEKEVQSVIFTAGHVLGDDDYAKKIFGRQGIKNSKELADRLNESRASIIVKYLTFDNDLHLKMVDPKRKDYDYTSTRDKGLVNLIGSGFNFDKVTRLGVDCLMMKENYKEAVDLFSFFNQYNIFAVLNTSMDCGNTLMKNKNPSVLSKEEALETAISLYKYCADNDIPFDERISPYFCSRVCSQLNHGLFIGDNNSVKACPGGPVIGEYKSSNLKELWENNPFRDKYNGIIGHECISRYRKNLHKDFEERVKGELHE